MAENENKPKPALGGRGGPRPGSGRKPGSPNKVTQAQRDKVAATGITPLDYMLDVLRNKRLKREVRMAAAVSAAPYVHPRLAAVEMTGKDGGPIEFTNAKADLARRIARHAGTGKPASPASGDRLTH